MQHICERHTWNFARWLCGKKCSLNTTKSSRNSSMLTWVVTKSCVLSFLPSLQKYGTSLHLAYLMVGATCLHVPQVNRLRLSLHAWHCRSAHCGLSYRPSAAQGSHADRSIKGGGSSPWSNKSTCFCRSQQSRRLNSTSLFGTCKQATHPQSALATSGCNDHFLSAR